VKISIILATLNSERFLESTLKSIINQKQVDIEIIVVDGGSKDGTLEIIKKYSSSIDAWISEKDKGISDAFNKGIHLCTGDYINFQGDGDGFISSRSVFELFDKVDISDMPLVCGNITRIDENEALIYSTKINKNFSKKSLLFKMSLPHQGLFMPRGYFDQYGFFDLQLKFSMDYELLLRSYDHFPRVVIKNLKVAKWRRDGIGEGNTLKVLNEYNLIKSKNKIASKATLALIHYFTIFKYFIKKII